MNEALTPIADGAILHDVALTGRVRAEWFDPAWWASQGTLVGSAPGRGAAAFVRAGAEDWVLRHYRRGGWIARFVEDRYLWLGEARVRAFREWRLTARLHRLGLPVPRPVAAVYVRHGATYRADLITARIPDAETLAERVHRGEADETLWRRVGATIGRFHAAGLDHADLNARNVLIAGGDVFLLDLDRGVLRPPGSWSRRNLARLERSLLRLHQREAAPAPRAADRQALLAGYASAGSE